MRNKEISEHIDNKNGRKNIWLLGSSSLLNDAGSDMITPILPFFITALGGSGIAVGALSGLREGLASLFKLLGGWYSDKKAKRMPIIFAGYFISVLCKFLIAISASWQYLLAFVSIERFGKARDPPRDAIIAMSTKKRGRGFGIHQMMDTIGAIIGSIIVIFLFWKFNFGFKTIILIGGIIASLSLFPLIFIKEPKTKPQNISLFRGIRKLSKNLRYFIFVSSIFTIANFGLYMFLLLKAQQITGSLLIAISIGILFHLAYALFAVPFGIYSDKIGRKKVLMMGYLLFLAVTIGFIFSQTIVSLIILFLMYGIVYAITQGNQRAFVSDMSGEMKGTALGFFQFVTGLVTIVGGIIAGFFWNISPQAMFIYLSAIALISILALSFVKER
ncbi:MAG: MFS transporter [Candidatus Pacearchaeota archaeon]